MSQVKEFISKHISPYLNISRSNKGATHIPPTSNELEELIKYLTEQGTDPIIVGSVALVIHLNLSFEELNDKGILPMNKVDIYIESTPGSVFRPTQDLDLFVSKNLPKPPQGWRRDKESIGVISWISPTGGFVDFLVAGHQFPDSTKNPQKIGKDPRSEKLGCPVADLESLFLLKLNSMREKDLTDLLGLAKQTGIPHLQKYKLNQTQKENLELIKLGIG